jgi:hypothetical protein
MITCTQVIFPVFFDVKNLPGTPDDSGNSCRCGMRVCLRFRTTVFTCPSVFSIVSQVWGLLGYFYQTAAIYTPVMHCMW